MVALPSDSTRYRAEAELNFNVGWHDAATTIAKRHEKHEQCRSPGCSRIFSGRDDDRGLDHADLNSGRQSNPDDARLCHENPPRGFRAERDSSADTNGGG